MADPFEEFEFKPLTEGLGFHKKNKKSSPILNESRMDMLDTESPLRSPLPRENRIQYNEPSVDDSSAAVDEILQTLRSKKVESERVVKSPKKALSPKYKTSTQNISAFFLDSMLVLAATLLCMIVVLSVTKADVTGTLFSDEPNAWIYLATATLFATVTFIYLVAHRIFLGATPGEWAYDQRVGSPEELGTAYYAINVILRGALIVLTGIIILPIVSLIMNRDLAGEFTGTQILERA